MKQEPDRELKAPDDFRARRTWDNFYCLAIILAAILFIFFLVDGFNNIPAA